MRALCEPVLIGPANVLSAAPKGIRVVKTVRRACRVGEIRPEHGLAALDAARKAIEGALAGEYHAVVAAPHSETAIHAAGIEFDGYPSFVARAAGLPPEDGILMLCFAHEGREVRIAHVTLHSAVADAVKMISKQRVLKTIRAVDAALKKLGIEKPKIAVSGVNPHASGDEERRVIGPAIQQASETTLVDGPIGADTLIQRAGYDAYVVMLHDQGHVAAKLLAPNRAAALTIGTPV
ncbi:MAG: 4-hydroxythreonine-4-phosphate dehydrogenase PdxA, partial [Burkholderiales bacterium]